MSKALLLPAILLAALLVGCVSQSQTNQTAGYSALPSATQGGDSLAGTAAKGDTVAVDYVGTLDDGTVFDTSIKADAQKAGLPLRPSYEPLEFAVGAGQMIKGFDDAVVGMKVGDEKKVHLQPADAYGEKRKDMIATIPKANIGGNVSVGDKLSSSQGLSGVVTNVTNDTVTADFNHELAGKALNFRIIMRKITKA